MTQTQPQHPNAAGADPSNPLGGRTAPGWREEYQPNRKYLNASNWFFLALKVFGYNLLGYFMVALIALVVFFVIRLLANVGS